MYKGKNHYTLFRRNGYWYYCCYDPNTGERKRYSTGTKKKGEALAVIQERIEDGNLCFPSVGMTYGEYVQDFWTEENPAPLGKTVAVSTRLIYRRTLDTLCEYWGKWKITSINKPEIKKWLEKLKKQPRMSGSTVSKYFNVFAQTIAHMHDFGAISINPCDGITIKIESRGKDVFTDADLKALFSVPWREPMIEAMILLTMTTGMRIGEIQALTKGQIKDGRILVDRSFSQLAKCVKSTKNGKPRVVPLADGVLEFIRANTEWDDIAEDGFIFSYDRVHPVYEIYVLRALQSEMRRAGIDFKSKDNPNGRWLTIHSFRYVFNSELINSGLSWETAQEIVGHSSDTMTSHYLNLNPDRIIEIRKSQDRLLGLTSLTDTDS